MLQGQTAHRAYAPRPPRTAGVVFIAVLHTLAIYAFLTALGTMPKPIAFGPLTVTTLPSDIEKPDVPPPEPPKVEYKPPVVVAPTIEIQIDPAPSQTAIVLPPLPPRVAPPAQVDPPVTMTPLRGIMSTHTTPEYPILARRLGEQGTVRLALTVGDDGMVSEAKVAKSSGFSRLDEAAIDWVKRYWRYQPAMRGNMPVASMTEAILQFRLDR